MAPIVLYTLLDAGTALSSDFAGSLAVDPKGIGWPDRKCRQPSRLSEVGSENASKGVFTEAKLSTGCGSRFSKDRWYVVVTSLVDTLKYDREYKRVGEVKGTGRIYGPILSLPVCASRC